MTELAHEPLLSIVIPVRNDTPIIDVIVRILDAIVEVQFGWSRKIGGTTTGLYQSLSESLIIGNQP